MKCRSQSRCGRIDCEPCARRYAGRLARRLHHTGTGSFHAIEIAAEIFSPAEFHAWRVKMRNLLDHRRRKDRWWRDFCVIVWFSADGHVRGIVRVGPLTGSEVTSAFEARWATTLRAIEPADLRGKILAATDPAVIAAPPNSRARYQPLKLAIWPQRMLLKAAKTSEPRLQSCYIEPMPVVF